MNEFPQFRPNQRRPEASRCHINLFSLPTLLKMQFSGGKCSAERFSVEECLPNEMFLFPHSTEHRSARLWFTQLDKQITRFSQGTSSSRRGFFGFFQRWTYLRVTPFLQLGARIHGVSQMDMTCLSVTLLDSEIFAPKLFLFDHVSQSRRRTKWINGWPNRLQAMHIVFVWASHSAHRDTAGSAVRAEAKFRTRRLRSHMVKLGTKTSCWFLTKKRRLRAKSGPKHVRSFIALTRPIRINS